MLRQRVTTVLAVLVSGGCASSPPVPAVPGWKRELGKRLDALVDRNVSGVRKAVKWNSWFYGPGLRK